LLARERRKLKDVEASTLVEYIKTSIEILMNMRLEEYQLMQAQKNSKKPSLSRGGAKPFQRDHPPQLTLSSCESFVSLDEPPKDYELMLQKYEAEVRNHIKIEQQLKLHIEVLQDKLEDAEKTVR
jgi:hypothetical protein